MDAPPSSSSNVRVVFDRDAYGARLEILECMGARVAIVLRRGLLAAVAPMPGSDGSLFGLEMILDSLREVPSLTAASLVR